MESKEILKEEEFLAGTEERAAVDPTMFSAMETFEISGKVLLPNNDIAWRDRLSFGDRRLEKSIESLGLHQRLSLIHFWKMLQSGIWVMPVIDAVSLAYS